MAEEHTTAVVQRYLIELAGVPGDAPAEPIIRALLSSSVDRLHWLCAALLHRNYPRLASAPQDRPRVFRARQSASRQSDGYNRTQALKTTPRFLAARCAAAAGCGVTADRPPLDDAQRKRWRRQSRQWLEAETTARSKALNDGTDMSADLSKRMLTLFQTDPDLAQVREADGLNKLPAEERPDWTALWKQMGDLLAGARHTGP